MAADQRLVPSWMSVDAAAHRVRLDIVAGWNGANERLNFNGYAEGDATVVVPLGWTVDLAFKNDDERMPHSLVVTKAYGTDEMPNVAGLDQVAIRRASTQNPGGGTFAPNTDTARFTANKDGDGAFFFFCGAPGHGRAGMWMRFTVDDTAAAPYLLVAEKGASGRK
jgi:hypothetical protein